VAVIPAEFGDVAARRALKSDLSRYLHKLALETGKLLTRLELDFKLLYNHLLKTEEWTRLITRRGSNSFYNRSKTRFKAT
jgi:hypothetical protein